MFVKGKYVKMQEAGDGGAAGGAAGGDTSDNTGGEQPTPEQIIAKLEGEKAALLSKNNELLGETKIAKNAKRQLEEEAQAIKDAAAKESGDFKQLHESSEQQRTKLEGELNALKQDIAKKELQGVAVGIANDIAEGKNAKLLARFVEERLKSTEEGIMVVNKAGELTVATHDDLKKEFEGDSDFAALIKGTQSSGGGATGGKGTSGGAAKELARSEFETLTPTAKMKFVKSGGKVI